MTSTTEILNDTTSVQSRIDTVLGSVDRELDWSNNSGWQPGAPLYERPQWLQGGQYVRRLFDLHGDDHWDRWILDIDVEDGSWAFVPWAVRCRACQVSWTGPEACWVCGDPSTGRSTRPAPPTPAWSAANQASLGHFPRRVVMGFDGSRDSDVVAFTLAPGAVMALPEATDASAPSVADLTAAMVTSTGISLDDYQRAFINAWFSEARPATRRPYRANPLPQPLSIDGHAYRRRTKRRNRR